MVKMQVYFTPEVTFLYNVIIYCAQCMEISAEMGKKCGNRKIVQSYQILCRK